MDSRWGSDADLRQKQSPPRATGTVWSRRPNRASSGAEQLGSAQYDRLSGHVSGQDSESSDEPVPFVSDKGLGPPEGTSSTTTAVINLAKTTIGAGIMAMPKSMQLLGLLFGSGYIMLLASVIYYSLAILVKAAQHTGQWTYKGTVQVLVGRTAALVLQVVILMANAGGMTACLILIADILVGGDDSPDGGLFLMWGISTPVSSATISSATTVVDQRWFVLLFIVVVFMLPLCMQEHMSSLRHSSIIGLALAAAFTLSTVVLGLVAVSRGRVHGVNIFPRLECPPPMNILHLHRHHHPPPPPPTAMHHVEHLIDRLLQNPTSPPPEPPALPPAPLRQSMWGGVLDGVDDDPRSFVTWGGILKGGGGGGGGKKPLDSNLTGRKAMEQASSDDGSKLTGLCRSSHFIALASDLIDASAVCLGAFVCHYSIHPIMNEMRERNPSSMLGVIARSNTAALVAYLATAWGGYVAFSDTTSENLLKNFDVPDLMKLVPHRGFAIALSMFVRLGYAVVMLTTYPLINFSFRSRVYELIDDLGGMGVARRGEHSFRLRLALTLATLTLTYALAVILPDIWVIMSFVGATCSVFMSFLMPAALSLKMDPKGRRTQLMAGVLLLLGGVLVIGGIGNILFL